MTNSTSSEETIVTDEYGNIFYYNKNGKYHRENDQPAIIHADGKQEWWVNGQFHRENDKPAVIYKDGIQYWWYVNGVFIK
jgi:hypothetical protein